MTTSYFYPISFYPKTMLKYRQYQQFIICFILSSQPREMCETAPAQGFTLDWLDLFCRRSISLRNRAFSLQTEEILY